MKRVSLIGAGGFVGSAFLAHLSDQPGVEVVAVTRRNYAALSGTASDITIEAACNSRKYLADESPVAEFDLSVTHRLRTLVDFPAALQVHLSSVDVYSDLSSPETTREDAKADLTGVSTYGFHKLLAENLVKHYAASWLIIRLGGMVGPNLRKNPVFDILHDHPLRIHPDSRYQFMHTSEVSRIVWNLISIGLSGEILNLCGDGLISPREISAIAGRPMNLELLESSTRPRIVDASLERIKSLCEVPETLASVTDYINEERRD